MHPAVMEFLRNPIVAENDPASDMEKMFVTLDRAAITNRHARAFEGAVTWILAQDNKSVLERISAVCKLIEHSKTRAGSEVVFPGGVKKFCKDHAGW
jgi:hypothetical protein